MKSYKKIFIVLPILFFLFLLVYIALNYEFRRNTLKRSVAFYNLYQNFSIKDKVLSKNFSGAVNQLENYVDFSQKISPGKNMFFESIVELTYFAASNTRKQNELDLFENLFNKILDIDPDIYSISLWQAKALSNNDQKKSMELLDKAINLSPINENAYREIVKNDWLPKEFLKKYCEDFRLERLGGSDIKNSLSFFKGNTLSKFAISIQNKNFEERIFPQEIKELENFEIYSLEIVNKDFSQINFLFSLPAGSKITFEEIYFKSKDKDQEKIQIKFSDLIFISKNNFFLNNNADLIEIIDGRNGDDLISLIFKNNTLIKKIEKIFFKIKFSRLGLTNNSSVCIN
jgi:hypothetical protein